MKTFLSMSVSGGLLIVLLLLGKRLLQDKVSRQWQYYIWLIVILRLLLPFGPERAFPVKTAGNQTVIQAGLLPRHTDTPDAGNEKIYVPTEAHPHSLPGVGTLLTEHLWVVWMTAALGLLTRKAAAYRRFLRHLKAGLAPVSDPALLNRLSVIVGQAGVKKPVGLCVNPLVSSPMLIGYFHPCIVLPSADIPEADFPYIVLHELIHYQRRDMLYKWLVQVTVCLHWFNPLVHLMGREITKACEFSCDEAVLIKMGRGSAQDYGKTLLHAMAAAGTYKEHPGAVTLSENKQMLKERLCAIMNFKKKSIAAQFLTCVLTLCLLVGAVSTGVYSAAAEGVPHPPELESLTFRGTTYYLIRNENELRALGAGKYGMDQNYMQQADIQLSPEEWVPIGTWDNPFTGTFNGNGFEISGLIMTDPYAELAGLFGVTLDAEIYNITLRDFDITRAGRRAGSYSAGAILAIGGHAHDNFVIPKESETRTVPGGDDPVSMDAERAYGADSLPLFQIAFSRLDEEAQGEWLDNLYEDQALAFFGAAVSQLDEGCALIERFAETAYLDNDIAFFSCLVPHMRAETLEYWLDTALEDGELAFQSVLFNALGRDSEFDEQAEKWAKEADAAQQAEYRAAGVTMDGKDYYYRGQLVNIFLDIRNQDKSFYTLDINPAGTVNLKIIRDADNQIAGVAYLTEAEIAELFGTEDERG